MLVMFGALVLLLSQFVSVQSRHLKTLECENFVDRRLCFYLLGLISYLCIIVMAEDNEKPDVILSHSATVCELHGSFDM
jgi:hypothetical protein